MTAPTEAEILDDMEAEIEAVIIKARARLRDRAIADGAPETIAHGAERVVRAAHKPEPATA